MKLPTKELYNHISLHKDEFEDWYVAVVGFMCTYANNWMGSYYLHKNPDKYNKSMNSLLKQDLSGISFRNCDYRDISVGEGNVFYCDPPYRVRDNYKSGFDHEAFYSWTKQTSRNNIVLISEYYMPPEFKCIWTKPVKANIHPKSRVDRTERLFIYEA